ncbi:MAG: hypothetical protein AB1Z98_24295 [Nannocystaceae bacterium]
MLKSTRLGPARRGFARWRLLPLLLACAAMPRLARGSETFTVGPGLAAQEQRWAPFRRPAAVVGEDPAGPRARFVGVAGGWVAVARPGAVGRADRTATSTSPQPGRPAVAPSSTESPITETTESAAAADDDDRAEKLREQLARLLPQVRLATRINTTVQGDRRDRLDGYRFDTLLLLPRLTGSITDYIGWQLGFFARATDFSQAELRVLDVVAELRILPQLQLWAGRFVTPADRSNLSGPFLIPTWNYPGIYGGQLLVKAADGPVGRDTGAVIWGDVAKGRFKYYAAVQGLEVRRPPRLAARTNVALLGSEPGYYNAGGYLGKRDVLAVGASAQYQPKGQRIAGDPDDPMVSEQVLGDLWVVDVDLLAEKNFGRGGTPSLEATYFAFDRFAAHRHAYFVGGAYLLPWEIGPGGLQGAVRWQQAFPGTDAQPRLWGVDAAATYLFAGYRARMAVVYQHQSLGDGGPRWNAINIGFQFIAG